MILLVGAGPIRAQAGPGVAGRWRVEVKDLTPLPLAGELFIRDSLGGLHGTLLLSNNDGPPVSLEAVSGDENRVAFRLPGDQPLFFTGVAQRLRIDGAVESAGRPVGRWSAERLDPVIPFYPVLPRFRLSQLVGGSGPAASTLPARMAVVAFDPVGRSELVASYQRTAVIAGLRPLDPAEIGTWGPARVMGLAERAATLGEVQRNLERIRVDLASDSLRRAFDAIFLPRGRWIVDLHSAALDLARAQNRTIGWEAVLPALRASGWIGFDSAPAEEIAPDAVQRFRYLATVDSNGARMLLARAATTAAASAEALSLLLKAYPQAESWHRQALGFLLTAAWVQTAGATRSPAQLVGRTWTAMMPSDAPMADRPPKILSRTFGHPQAVPQSGLPVLSIRAVISPLNWTAEEWIRRNGTIRLLEVARRLDGSGGGELLVERSGESFRVLSVGRRAAESPNGFLESEDAIVVDPGYVPLFALGAIVHEWGHLLVEGWRFARAVEQRDRAEIRLPDTNPWLNEGSAEAWTDVVLEKIVERYPIVGMSEAEKRARLAQTDGADPHVAGYLLVRAMLASEPAEKAGAAKVLGRLVPRDDPASILEDRVLSAGFPSKDGVGGAAAPSLSRRFLVPETVFTIENLTPDIVSTTIRAHTP